MSINIVGGSGFIGSRLVARLRRSGLAVLVVDKVLPTDTSISSKIADVRDIDSLVSAIETGVIVNLAAEHRDDVTPISLYDEVNVTGAMNICKCAEIKGINTIVFTSSVAVYGFAPLGTDESGVFKPFNDYGRTKLEAEAIFMDWQSKDPQNRTLVIIRPTVVFGEANRGNVYNLLNQIARGTFLMIGAGRNVKSLAYVENVAAFIQLSLDFSPGVHIYNYVDKPDLEMNSLVNMVYKVLGKRPSRIRFPYAIGLLVGMAFDVLARVSGRKFPISEIRIRKFCADTMFGTNINKTGFIAPVALTTALERTIRYEFVDDNNGKKVYFTE